MMSRTMKLSASFGAYVAAAGAAMPATAQTTGGSAVAATRTSDETSLGDIVVTAQRCAESIQNVPV